MNDESNTVKNIVVNILAAIVFGCFAVVLLTLTAVVVRAIWQIV